MKNNQLFIQEIRLEKNQIPNHNIYPYNIEIIKKLDKLNITCPVTFLIGENGIGKSTLIEAIAVSCGLNPEGGTENFMFETKATHSDLYKVLWINHFQRKCETKFFLRAESFYNVITNIDELQIQAYYGGNSLHSYSHGESFLRLIEKRFSPNGLYILDEPEAALSPSRQMTLLCYINKLVEEGSQFIIATHSPILISYQKGEIIDLNQNYKKVHYKDTEIYQTYKLYLDNPERMQKHLFEEEE